MFKPLMDIHVADAQPWDATESNPDIPQYEGYPPR